MNKKVSVSFTLMITSLAVLVTFMLTYVSSNYKHNRVLAETIANNNAYSKLYEVDKTVRATYFGEIDDQKLMDSVIDGYMRGIGDKYAEYMPKDKFMAFLQENRGTMVGIGVRVIFDNTKQLIEVISVMPDSPAETGGILPGDFIYKVEDEYIAELGYFTAVEKIKGEKGTQVTLTVLRGSDYAEEKIMTFTRDEVSMETVSSRKINDDIGYIRILEFNKETPNEFIAAMTELQNNGAGKFIFDVRYNPGGDLDGIKKTLDYLLPEGPIIRIVYKDGHEEVKYSDAKSIDAPMVVLINENTASAAELFASALRDYEKATLVGVTTYGKGTVQTIMPVGDGSGLRISQSMYSPPYGDNYEGIGVAPHIESKLPEDLLKEKSFYKLTDEEDTQLQEAIKQLNK